MIKKKYLFIFMICLASFLWFNNRMPDNETLKNELLSQRVSHQIRIGNLISEHNPKRDFALELYNFTDTRPLVEYYYGLLIGNKQIAKIILKNAAKWRISPAFAFALAWTESRYSIRAFNRNSTSIDRGLFQLNSKSFPHLSVQEFYNPEINAGLGMQYLNYCLKAGRNEVVALAMYNAGAGRVNKGKTPKMTLNYISHVLSKRDDIESHFHNQMLEFADQPFQTLCKWQLLHHLPQKRRLKLVLESKRERTLKRG